MVSALGVLTALLCNHAARAADGTPTSFLGAGMVNRADAMRLLDEDQNLGAARLREVEDAMSQTFTALPKNAHGTLGHQAVRYALHRYFVQRYGWYVKGLEPGNSTWHSDEETPQIQEWVPSFLQDLLEKHLCARGTSLKDLATLAAAFEDIVRKEVAGRLEVAYTMHDFLINATLNTVEVEEVMQTLTMALLVQGNYTASSVDEVERKESNFAKKYSDWPLVHTWLTEILEKRFGPREADKWSLTFAAVAQAAGEVGEQYYKINDPECTDVKATLLKIEGSKAGRVRLSDFYNLSLHTHWTFNEKVDYLRSLGALDESIAGAPQVIVPNYLMSRTNCLESSNLYSVCCRNECEDLMSSLERDLAAASAIPEAIASLVIAMPSAPLMSAALRRRLYDVAEAPGNMGMVYLHGRLFAQWMHHAFPRQCPYPHEIGTTGPQTPDEWMRETGEEASRATRSEMQEIVAKDICAARFLADGQIVLPTNCGEGEFSELPWSPVELLLGKDHFDTEAHEDHPHHAAAMAAASLLVGCVTLALVAVAFVSGPSSQRAGALRMALLFAGLFLAALHFRLLDPAVFLGTLALGSVLCATKLAATSAGKVLARSARNEAYAEAKCCV